MGFRTDVRQAPESWVLAEGQAQTLSPDTAGVLRIQSGRAWVTLQYSARHSDALARPPMDDDLFLDSAASLPLRARQIIVLEPWSAGPAAGVTLVWEVAQANSRSQRWQETVVQPAHEFGRGLIHAGLAFAKMVQGLLGYTALLLLLRYKMRRRTAD